MANRPIFKSIPYYPYYKTIEIEFTYYSGFSKAQKQKCIHSLHESYLHTFPEARVLEISTKSIEDLGIQLSAFNLVDESKYGSRTIECIFQSSKVFEQGGPYTDLLTKSSKDAKRDPRLRESGTLTCFKYFDTTFPLEPKDFFYNWIYISALYKNKELIPLLLEYDSFTDIEFNPKKSINCQAKAVATFIGLYHANLLEEAMQSKENFLKIVYNK